MMGGAAMKGVTKTKIITNIFMCRDCNLQTLTLETS
jgi:hypothetical protein